MNENEISRTGQPAGVPLAGRANPTHRILVVEDDADLRRLNAEVLMNSGYMVDAAEDGADAWVALNAASYDLMITDHTMPKVTGVELLKKLHATRMALPVILASGALPEDEFTRHPWLQPAATLMKPYTVVELLGTVEKVLRATDSPGEARAQPNLPNDPSTTVLRL